jgi:putative membrane protein
MVMTSNDHSRISDAVHRAEAGTAGEIVTIIADSSDRYLDVALWWSIAFAIAALSALAAFPSYWLGQIGALTGGWVSEWNDADLFELALAVTVIIFGAARLFLAWMPLRMLLVPGSVRSRRVRRRAIRYFKVGAERRTAARTGILIYLSMAEHRAEIVADEAIHGKVPAEAWGNAMAKLVAEVKQGHVADGMVAAIGDVGTILSDHFPRTADDINELPDRLIEL